MPYSPKNLTGESLEDLRLFVISEFEAIQRALNLFDSLRLKPRHKEPDRLVDGLVAYADGTDWNPGSGEGLYAYYGGGWNKL